MPAPKRKKQVYEIMPQSAAVRLIKVEAFSPEEACKTLQRKIAGKPVSDTDMSTIVFEETWSVPSEKGEEWLVAPELQSDHTTEVMVWNGKTISTRDRNEIFEGV